MIQSMIQSLSLCYYPKIFLKKNSNTNPRVQEEIELFVKEYLVLLVTEAEVLQELVSERHQFVHPHVFLDVVGNLQEVQDYRVHSDVAQQTLFVLARLRRLACAAGDHAEPVHADQDLGDKREQLVNWLLCDPVTYTRLDTLINCSQDIR